MGQRSQIYVRFNGKNKKGLIANYYQWNYGERMISRARWGIEYINSYLDYGWYFQEKRNATKLSRIFDTNFDMKDIQTSCDIIAEYKEEFSNENLNDVVFKMQDNNDGKLFIDIEEDYVKYAFLDYNCDTDNIMDAQDYIIWNLGEDWEENKYLDKKCIDTCKENIKFILENATLMTKQELEEFINYDYEI